MGARRIGVIAGLTVLLTTVTPGVAAAAEPFVLDSCSAKVIGEPGQPVTLRPSAVEAPIVSALGPLDPLGVTTLLFRQVWSLLPPIPLGALPATGSSMINGDTIANAVSTQLLGLPVLSGVIDPLLGTVWTTIASTCGIVGEVAGTAQPAPPTSTPRPPGAPSTTPARPPTYTGSGAPAKPPVPAGAIAPEAPATNSASGSTVTQGSNVALEYPVEWKNRAPGLGVPPEAVAVLTAPTGTGGPVPQFGLAGQGDKVAGNRTAGSASPLPAEPGPRYGPILLAALLIALVAAQWVRMVVLRRTAPAGAARLGLRWVRVPMPVVRRD
ncbi:hypothetical protein [Actinokineospora sp. HUAS TT18]|uniref:hypothetical protein n=1 Tax=Actinokineospora sp. HUAS TT18 TaxID=3447451 RepID=UPI003F51EE7F